MVTGITRSFFVKDSIKLKKAFIKEVLRMVQLTISNLEDDSVSLREQYRHLICDTLFCRFYSDMKNVKAGLEKDSAIIDTISNYFPGKQIKKWLDTAHVYEVDVTAADKHYKVYSFNSFNDFIIGLYKDASYSNINKLEMSMPYRNSWRQIEYYYSTGKHYLDSLNKAYGTIIDCKTRVIDTFIRRLNLIIADSCKSIDAADPKCNPQTERGKMAFLMNMLRNPRGIRRWLWYTAGVITLNPLAVTTENRRYPTTEKWTVLDTSIFNAVKKMNTDSSLNNFFTTRKLLNDIQLPVRSNDVHKHLSEYYDNVPSSYNNDTWPSLFSRKDSVSIWIYNVSSKSNLLVTPATKVIPDQSNVITQINNALDQFPSLTNLAVQSNLAAILGGINGTNKTLPNLPPKKNLLAAGKFGTSGLTEISRINSTDLLWSFVSKETKEEEEEEADFVIIGSRKLVLKKTADPNQDKKDIIIASFSFRDDCKSCIDTVPHYIIDSFVAKDYCTTLDYHKSAIKGSIDGLTGRFKTFLDCAKKCIESVRLRIDSLTKIQRYLSTYMAIVNRSLPPDTSLVNQVRDENAEYSTTIFQASMLDSTIEETIDITKKEKINNKDSIRSIKKIKFKVGKLHYIEPSAGLAFTVTDYSTYETSGGGLPVRKDGDKIQVNAGINIYPWGLIKIDNRWRPTRPYNGFHRLSIYLGVAVTAKPLENIYTGVGYDVVPGIKTLIGAHWYKDTRYQIVNNQVFNQADGLKPSLFVALNIEPATLLKAFNIIK